MKRLPLITLAALLGLALLCASVHAKPTMTYRSNAESHLISLVNAQRLQHGMRPLVLDAKLSAAARSHSADMLQSGYFEHNSPHQTWDARVRSFTGSRQLLAENLAYGSGSYATARSVIDQWMQSPEHRANVLRPGLHRIGIGIAFGTYQRFDGTAMATADFSS